MDKRFNINKIKDALKSMKNNILNVRQPPSILKPINKVIDLFPPTHPHIAKDYKLDTRHFF